MRTIDILKPAANSISIQRLVCEFDRLLHKYPQETVQFKTELASSQLRINLLLRSSETTDSNNLIGEKERAKSRISCSEILSKLFSQ